MGLSRRPIVTQRTPDVEAEAAVEDEIVGSGSNVGYRRVWVSWCRKGVIARREDVRQLLLRLDPEGGSRENFGVEFIEHWDQITFGTSMDLIN